MAQAEGRALETPEEHFSREAATWDAKPLIREGSAVAASLLQRDGLLGADKAVLELGCGTGLLAALLLPHVRCVVGVDTAQGMVDKFNDKFGDGQRAVGVCADVLQRPDLAAAAGRNDVPQQYELAVSHMTYHHVDDVASVTRALANYLAPGGQLVVFDLLRTDTSDWFHPRCKHHTVHHAGGFALDEMQELLQGAGLEDCAATAAYSFERDVEGGPAPSMQFTLFAARGRKPVG